MTLRRSTVAAVALALAACSEPTVSDRGLDVTLTTDRTELRVGDTVRVTVEATNNGKRAVTINSNMCPVPFVVVDERGMTTMPGRHYCIAVLSMRTIAPGETYVAVRYARPLGTFGPDDSEVLLPAGTYTLRSTIIGEGLRAVSRPVTVRLLPR
jgi:hypothetical protein